MDEFSLIAKFILAVSISFTIGSLVLNFFTWRRVSRANKWYHQQHLKDCKEITRLEGENQQLRHQLRYPSHY